MPERSEPVRILTVSRQFGSGGGALAREVGVRLGWRVVDREVVQAISRELRLPEEEAEARDEHVSGLAERVGALLSNVFPETVPPPMPPPRVLDDDVRALCESVLREAVRRPPVVLVGHGAVCLFGDRADAFHVKVVAPEEERIARVRGREALGDERAGAEVRARDRARRDYLRHHYGADWDDPVLYHLVVNRGRLVAGEAEDVVIAAVRNRGAVEAPGAPGARSTPRGSPPG